MKNKPVFLAGEYHPEEFYQMAKGLEDVPEGGERCFYVTGCAWKRRQRWQLRKICDYFATTLTISPLKKCAEIK